MPHACHRFWKCYKTLTFCSLLKRCTIPCACHAKRHLNLQKWSRTCSVLYILTSKCASRHNGVHFFDIATSKSGPRMVCFVHFDFEMCFALHFFGISTSKSAPRPRCFVPFHFKICFAPQRRATFSFLISPDVSAPAALANLLFDPPEPQHIEKTQCFATFLPFRASASSFF